MDVPDYLREVAMRHEHHITELVSQLKSYGMDAQAIERSVDTLIESYRDARLSSAGLRAFWKIAERWQLTDEEQIILLWD